ncbi:Surface antigen [Mariniphaga anaerophila]|uniref:Surface antigen n=1 Tax=Mariniphaga anaerophila TaxID=1484053 RepID=A0A1M4TJV7_9BACT|nr:BamA/TamA family outer membrane protein [Mariniphaga anaerophila]SHE44675.1 Surface antigen [Mariniphaga anaerophila]
MKKLFTLLLFPLLFTGLSAQDEVAKTGWNFGALPTVTFDTDLGFQYGALVNLYNYGDGSRYPNYNHSLYFEVSRFTKGSGINRFYYDSDQLIEGLQTSLDISLLSDQAYDFYGFNGYDGVVNANWIDDESDDYITRMFYKYDRKMFRFKVDLQGKISGDKLKWATGINLLNFKIGAVDLDKLNKGKEGDDVLPDVDGLYEKYQQWGIISPEEANGGFIPELKAGLVYDTRDNRPNPMKGVWTEAVLIGAPEFLGAESGFAKLSFTHRQYFTLIPKNLSLAYRLAYQTTLAGHAPFYYQTQVIVSELKGATSEGLGGAKSLRGVRRNRIVGDGFFYGNLEARWKFARFRFINNNFYLGLNGFMDFGQVTKKIDVNIVANDAEVSPEPLNDYFDKDTEKMHFSYGAGLRIVMNQNFVIAVDYGMAADERDGDSGLYIGLNYLF